MAQDIIDTGKARRTVIGAQVGRPTAVAGGGVRLAAVEPAARPPRPGCGPAT